MNSLSKSIHSSLIEDQFEQAEAVYWQAGVDSRGLCVNLIEDCKKCHHPMLGYAYVLYGRILLAFGEDEKALNI